LREPVGTVTPQTLKNTMRLLLVEDDDSLAAGLVQALARAGYEVTRAERGDEALRLSGTAAFDACILDLGLPDRDGIEVLRQLRGRAVATPVLILTARDALDDRILGLDAGADDYLVKPFELGELEARLRALIRRRSSESAPWRQLGLLRFDIAGQRAFAGEAPLELTKREMDVLECLMRRPGRIIPKEVLMDAVFPQGSDTAENTVEVHVSRLRRKIEQAGVTVRALRGLGYRLEERKPGDDAG
jgi:DNA-binding response OmpR family regulator